MIKRKAYRELLEWKDKKGQSSLLVEGARRTGKSFLIEEFGKNEYKSYILIDFSKEKKRYESVFDDLSDLDKFFQALSNISGKRLYKRESLIIFDEVQMFPRAREVSKYLVQDGRYDIISTGSLISIKENVTNIVIPSEEDKLKMYPIDFEEFLDYMGEGVFKEHIIECIKNNKPLDNLLHKKGMNLFYEYMLVGGMPQAVVAFKESGRDFYVADEAKRKILNLYKDDLLKAKNKYKFKVSSIFNNIPANLSKHEKRIIFNSINENEEIERFSESLFWLEDSMMCNLCYRCNDPNVGLDLNKDESFVKCYMADTGLLVSLAFSKKELNSNLLYKNIMNGKLSINKGMLYENMIAQMIKVKGHDLYFYTRYNNIKHRNDIEIDFILTNQSKLNLKLYPIEVKSSKNYTTTSLNEFRNIYKKRIDMSYIIHPKTFSIENNLIKIPPYMFALMDI